MTTPSPDGSVVVVAGDVTLDWNIAHVQRDPVLHAAWSSNNFARACPRPGGAALLAELIAAVARRVPGWRVVPPAAPVERSPCDGRFGHSYALWEPIDDDPAGPSGWRVASFLGLDARRGEITAFGPAEPGTPADVIVFDDANLGYREATHTWEPLLDAARTRRSWIVLKMSQPVAAGPLWYRLVRDHADRLVLIVTAADLRRTPVQVSQQISWEQTAEDLTWELTYNAPVNGLSRCAFGVVSFDTVGALVLSATACPPAEARLLFDPEHMEGEWAARFRGGMVGNTATLTAAIVREVLRAPDAPDVIGGCRHGVAAMRRLLCDGYDAGAPEDVVFPVERVARYLEEDETRDTRLGLARVQPPLRAASSNGTGRERGRWSILGDAHRGGLGDLASAIVRDGLRRTIADAPIGSFASLRSIDRREIEGLRGIGALIKEYVGRRESRPLSIAVFGAPGAGKSFAVKQVAASIGPAECEIVALTFNLSQLEDPAALLPAFHQVRDVALRGKVPLVFWDEFDAAPGGYLLGWLRHFLAPMQDGEFFDGQMCHPIGRAIFVFAGGTAARLDELGAKMTDEERRAAKVPDFVSRLKGTLEVLGPDPLDGSPAADPFFVVRRAILVRSMLERSAPALFRGSTLQIDEGVLRAILEVKRYAHGARSIESLLAMSQLAGRTEFVRSALPPEPQLALHVNPAEFLAHVHRPDLTGTLLEELAVAFHEHFCTQVRASGDGGHGALRPFAGLPPDEQEQNRAVVRDLPRKLASRGYVMMPNRRDAPPFRFEDADVEALAVEEHGRWMAQKLRDGWQRGDETKKEDKRHRDLVAFEALPPLEQEKDRQQVRDIPRVLERIGYTVVRVPSSAS